MAHVFQLLLVGSRCQVGPARDRAAGVRLRRALVGRVGRVLFVNPGGAGRKRFRLPRSVALLDLSGPEARAGIVALSPP
jgi:hypothetical protein